MPEEKKGLDKKGFPIEEGIYLAKNVMGSKNLKEIDVYKNKYGTLCCFSGDFVGPKVFTEDDSMDGHVPARRTGLEFIAKVGELK